MTAQREPSVKVFILVWMGSLTLLSITAGGACLHPGPFRTVLSLIVAVAMMLLQMLFYMRLWYRSGLMRLFAFSGFYWLLLMIGMSLTDYLTRVQVPAPW